MVFWYLLECVSGICWGVCVLLHTQQALLTTGPRLFMKGLLVASFQTGVCAPSGSDADSGSVVIGADRRLEFSPVCP